MEHGFVKVAAVTPDIRVADVEFNAAQICRAVKRASKEGAKVIVLPELCLSGYSCGDLFLQNSLLVSCREQLSKIAEFTREIDALVFVGLPFEREGKLFNVAAALCGGRILAFVPKTYMEKVDVFEDFITLLGNLNRNNTPLMVNSFYIIDDEKQRGKMTEEFYAAVKKKLPHTRSAVTTSFNPGARAQRSWTAGC